MTPEKVLSYSPQVLTQAQREDYFENGYIKVENLIPEETLIELQGVIAKVLDESRKETKSGSIFDLGPGHSSEIPVLRRLKKPDDYDEVFWKFASGLIADVAADLAGPDVVFHHSKLNFKWNDGNDDVKWHQDVQFFPHTNYNVFTIGCYLNDTGMKNGPLGVIPGSHQEKLYDLYHGEDWTGCLNDADADSLSMKDVEYLTGGAGSITIHNCRTLHFSPPSQSVEPRPLLLNCYTSADAKPYTPHPDPSSHAFSLVRGNPVRWADHDPRPCLIPPDWSGGYTSIFAAQTGENY